MPYVPDVIPEEDRVAVLGKYLMGNKAQVEFGKHPALLVVDMTNAFVLDDYPTGFAKTGIPCAKSIKMLEDHCRKFHVPIIYTTGLSTVDDLAHKIERGRWNDKSSMPPFQARERANEIYQLLTPQHGDIVIPKAKPSGFFGTQLVSILNYLNIDTLIVTGMVTSGCVRATVLDSFSYNYRTFIPEECVADRSQISHEVSLFDIDGKYAEVLKLSIILEFISKI